jgi:hypothetical protein
MSSVGGASFTATSSRPKNSAVTIYVRAAPDAGFKACCMKSGAYDGSNRDDYFQGVVAGRRVSRTNVIPGRRESGEPGIHNHDGKYGGGEAVCSPHGA